MNTELTARCRITELTNTVLSREVTQPEMFAKILQCLDQTIKEVEELRARSYHLDARVGDNVKNKALEALRRTEREKDEGPIEKPKPGPTRGHTYSETQRAKIYRAKYGREAPEDRMKAQEKTCVKCHVMKPFVDYHSNTRNADGKDNQCKKYKAAYNKSRLRD